MLSYIHISVSDFFCTSVLFVTVFSHTAVHCLFIFNFFPFIFFFFLAKLPNIFQNMCTYILYMRFQCINFFVFLSPDMYETVVLPYYAIKPYFL